MQTSLWDAVHHANFRTLFHIWCRSVSLSYNSSYWQTQSSQVLVNHCQLWISRLTSSLSSVTFKEAGILEENMKKKFLETSEQARTEAEGAGHLSSLETDMATLKSRIESVQRSLAVLSLYKVSLTLCSHKLTSISRHPEENPSDESKVSYFKFAPGAVLYFLHSKILWICPLNRGVVKSNLV